VRSILALALALAAAPAGAVEWTPIAGIQALGGAHFFRGDRGTLSGNADAVFAPAIRLNGSWSLLPSARCMECHAVDRIGITTTKGVPIATPSVKASFHQRLKQTDCRACHSEHPGSRGNLAHAGFTHAMLAPADRDDCASCHSAPGDALHRGVTGSCATCHSTERWKPATFDHQKYWPLDRDHSATCVTCHPGNVFEKYTCYGCHEHSPARMRREHDEVRTTNLDDCVRCHKSPNDDGEGRERGEHGERRGGRRHGGGDDD
jgi:hypothetical protein